MNEVFSDPRHTPFRGGYIFGLLGAVCYGSITTFATVGYDVGLKVEHLVISADS